MKLILSLTDNWTTAEGIRRYVQWAGGKHPEEFYVNPKAIELYESHQAAIANRVNTITGRTYKNEPAIFAWNLVNEPRSFCNISNPNATCEASQTAAIQVCNDCTRYGCFICYCYFITASKFLYSLVASFVTFTSSLLQTQAYPP